MTHPHEALPDRILELLADRALFGLSADEQAELDELLAASPVADPDALDRLAADLNRSYLPDVLEPLPEPLAARVLADAPAILGKLTPRRSMTPVRTFPFSLVMVGLAIAASLLLVIGLWSITRPPQVPNSTDRRNHLLAEVGRSGSPVIRLEWTATADRAAKGATGDVVWNTETQEGYMLFRGLVSNNPSQEQYQLWVFDAARDERYPVDGGVFDVPEGGGDVIVPIRAKLRISRPTLFAVTVEPPGGVVVSSRERLPLLAKVPPKPG